MRLTRFFFLSILIFSIFSCGTYQNAYLKHEQFADIPSLPKEGLLHTSFLIGDAGGLDDYYKEQNVVFDNVANQLNPNGKHQSIIFLGDNIYSNGLSKKEDLDRSREEKIINAHLALAKKNTGSTYFIPGNHDWNNSRTGGRKSTIRQFDYVNKNKGNAAVNFFPKNACGDPEVVKISKNLVFLFIDSQWWLQKWRNEKNMNKGCEIKTRRAFATEIQDLFIKYKNDQIVVFLHHPFFSNGNHGGKFAFKDHLFPLTALNKKAYLPLPILGSVVPLLRNLGISRQDISNALYQDLHEVFLKAIKTAKSNRVIFASGHDHMLQHFNPRPLLSKDNINYLVSGAGSKSNYAQKGGQAEFVLGARGFQILRFFEDESVWLDIISVDKNGEQKIEYRRRIAKPVPQNESNYDHYGTAIAGDTTTTPNASLKAKGLKRAMLGDQYRKLWLQPIEASYVDVEKIEGGLIPVKLGGGASSNSLRLEAKSGKQYILRSVNKDYYKLFPKQYKQLYWIKVYADQNASAIPYGAVMVPRLSDALGIYHANPELFYLKKQKGLLQYNELLNEGLYLFERRPSGKAWEDEKSFGQSKNIIGFNDLIYNLENKSTHFVDQKWVIKSRLFDMWIHDWDRHDDQWRWAAFDRGNKTIYRPIPRDRDWAFFKYKGLAYRYFATFYIRKFRTFRKEIKDIRGLNTSASHFDRHFMNELTWEDWEQAVDSMQMRMTPEIIAQAINDMPEEALPHVKKELQEKLEQRLKDMKKYARQYYEILYKEVEIVGTDEEDLFEVDYMSGGKIAVRYFRDSKKNGKILRYQRIFNPNITKEIRLYGLGDDDDFTIKGKPSNDIKLRIIGGEGNDKIKDGHVAGKTKDIIIHDDPNGIKGDHLHNYKTHINNRLGNNEYNRYQFQYNTFQPKWILTSSFDDGLMIGAGFVRTIHGFRKSPFKSQHNFDFSIAPNSRTAFNLNYSGHFTNIFSSYISFQPKLFIQNPNNLNFFGFQNEFPSDNSLRRFNWVRLKSYGIHSLLSKGWNNNRITFSFGPTYESHQLQLQAGRILDQYDQITEQDFERDHFLGFKAAFNTSVVEQPNDPDFGFKLNISTSYNHNIKTPADALNLNTSFTFYFPLTTSPKITLANRIGYNRVFGDPELYQLPSLGVNTFLRPYRNDRFRGDGVFFHQIDLRMNLFNWNNHFLPMTVGVTGGYDYAKAYVQDVENSPWLKGYTTGLSLNILNTFVLHPYMTFSEEGEFFNLATGFAF